MHPQHPSMMRINAEMLQREVRQNMRLQQARAAARGNQLGLVSSLRRSLGSALIATGDWIKPVECPVCQRDAGVELERPEDEPDRLRQIADMPAI